MSEQLDWLARNVHVWGKYCGKWIPEDAIGKLRFDGGLALIEPKFCAPFHVTRQQWLDRRAELQGKPSWNDAPEWATHLAQHAEGVWGWMAGAPDWGKLAESSTQSVEVAHPKVGKPPKWTKSVGAEVWNSALHEIARVSGQALAVGEVLGDWRDTLERRPTERAVIDEQPLSRADALRWAVENVKTWPSVGQAASLNHDCSPAGWEWTQACGLLYLSAPRSPVIGERGWSRAVKQRDLSESAVTARLQEATDNVLAAVPELMSDSYKFEPLTSLEDSKPASLHTIHHAAFLHHDCQLLLNEPELVVFRTADGELLHCKPKECLIDPDQYGLAARLLSDMSGYAVAPEHIRELCEQMNWRVEG